MSNKKLKILFFGDSVTCAERTRDSEHFLIKYGNGYVSQIAAKLMLSNPTKYEIINRGIGGHKSVDLYARIKSDVWNEKPDIINILVGVNDVAMEVMFQEGVDINRYENIYRLIIEETKKNLPNAKIILVEPFVLPGTITNKEYDKFLQIKDYAKVVEKLAKEYNLNFLTLQKEFDDAYKRYGEGVFLVDGIHPTIIGAKLIADKWCELFNGIIKDNKEISQILDNDKQFGIE